MSRFYTVAELAGDINSKLSNGSAQVQVSDFYARIDEGRRRMLKKIDPPELVRNAYLEEAIYDQINKYAIPDDLVYTNIINLRKLSGYRNVDRQSTPLEQVYRRRFDQKRVDSKNVFSVNYTNGLKTMSIFRPTGLPECQSQIINKADSLTVDGIWNVGGNVVNLTLDKLKYISGHGAIKFDFNSSSTEGSIEVALTTPSDLFSFLETGAVFTWLDISNFLVLRTVKMTLFSSDTQYYEMTVNSAHDNNVWANNWNLLKYQLSSMIAVNAPNPRAITGVRFDFTTNGEAMLGCHLDNIIARRGQVYDIDYQSAFIIMDADTGAWKKRATSPNDIVIAEEDTYQILMLESAISVMEEATNSTTYTSTHITNITQELNGIPAKYRGQKGIPGAYDFFKMAHPSEQILSQDTIWIFGNYLEGLSDAPIQDYQDEYGDTPTSNCGGCGTCFICGQ